MQAVVEVGCILSLDAEADRMRAEEVCVGEFGGVGEVGGGAGDVVARWEEECGRWFGDGDGGEARREVGGKGWRRAAH